MFWATFVSPGVLEVFHQIILQLMWIAHYAGQERVVSIFFLETDVGILADDET